MVQKKYTDVVRLGHKSTVGVLNEGDNIIIQEKLDGANASFTLDELDLKMYSRNTELSESKTLGGFYNFVKDSFENKKELLNPNYIYFGEWLNPHKVKYENYEKHFFLFDIYSKSENKYLDFSVVKLEANNLGLNLIPVFYEGKYDSYEQLEKYVGSTALNAKIGDKVLGEGIVVKNVDYVDRFGNQMYVKLVVDEFVEVQKQKKSSDPNSYKSTDEYKLAESLVTKARVEKTIFKLRDEGLIADNLEKKDIGLIFKESINRVYADLIKEESDSINSELDEKLFRKHTSSITKNIILNHLKDLGIL